MNATKKFSMFFMIMITTTLFISNSQHTHNVISEVGETFALKDTFDNDQYQNRIYTEYENYTQKEYFRDVELDSCDFTTDKDGWSVIVGTTDNGISNGYFEIIAKADNHGYTYVDNVNLTTYTHLEFRVWMNVTTNYLYLTMADYLGAWMGGYGYGVNIPANTWTTLNYTISDDLADDTRFISLYFHSVHNDYPVLTRLDYIRFWHDMKTDYATEELGDSWNFGEGDMENLQLQSSGYIDNTDFGVTANTLYVEYHKQHVSASYGYLVLYIDDISINLETYSYGIMRMRANTTEGNPHFYFRTTATALHDFTYLTTDYTYYKVPLYDFDIITELRFVFRVEGLTNDEVNIKFEADFFGVIHDDLEDTETHKHQETTSYRAKTGLSSFYNYVPKEFEYHGGLVANLNNSIKIDIPSLDYLPQDIRFYYYSNVRFVLNFVIGDTKYLIFNNSQYLNEWMYLNRDIDRGDIVLNNTEDESYFSIEVYSEETYTEIFIDDLNIIYTEPVYRFDHEIGVKNPLLDNNQWDYNSTNTYFSATPSDVAGSPMGVNTEGVRFTAVSDDIFSRRMYMNYFLSSSEAETNLHIYQETTIEIDKTYKIISWVVNKQYTTADYFNRRVDYHIELYENDVLINGLTIDDFTFDYAIDDFHTMNIEMVIIQEDYNTITLETVYINSFTGNQTSFQPFSFEVNKDNDTIHNTLNNVNLLTNMDVTPCWQSFPVLYYESSPDIVGKLTRDLKHSPVTAPIDTGLNTGQMPVWDDAHPFLSFFSLLGWYIAQFVLFVIDQFKQAGYIKDILTNIIYFFSSQIEALKNVLVALGDIDNLLDLGNVLLDYIGEVLGNVLSYIMTMAVAFIEEMLDVFNLELEGFPILEAIVTAFNVFSSGDFANFQDAWSNIIPDLDYELVETLIFIPNAFLGLFIADTSFLTLMIFNIIVFVNEAYKWITILVILYFVYLAQMLVRRDYLGLRREVETWVSVVNWIVNSITFIFHWLFELIHAVLDVTIPFT